jgi:hypothetical protein
MIECQESLRKLIIYGRILQPQDINPSEKEINHLELALQDACHKKGEIVSRP